MCMFNSWVKYEKYAYTLDDEDVCMLCITQRRVSEGRGYTQYKGYQRPS